MDRAPSFRQLAIVVEKVNEVIQHADGGRQLQFSSVHQNRAR